jgi:perosamine synthetase
MHPSPEHGEIPPTAGLQLDAGDLRPLRGADLAGALAALTDRPDALLTCSGTAALVVALQTLAEHSSRREVVVPGYTCPLVVLAIAHCGLRARLCDTRPGHFEMDPATLEALTGPQTLAVVPAHLGGRLADTETVARIAHAAGACVIEDAAQALGARHADATAAAGAGDIGLYSLAAGKGLSIYEGGLLMAAEPALHEALRLTARKVLARHPLWELRRSLELLGYWALYNPSGLRLAYGMPLRRALRHGDPVGAVGDRFGSNIPLHRVGPWRRAVGTRAAARLPAFLDQTREQARTRMARLKQLPGIEVLDDRDGEQGTWPYLLLMMPDECSRDLALERLWTRGIGVSRLFVHALPDYPELAGMIVPDAVPNARDFAARSLTVSNSPWLDDTRFDTIMEALGMALAEARQGRAT